ncbi:MAG TPA: amidase [Terriglobales bacterium]|nr:amidase [Terriglobales bacterium]
MPTLAANRRAFLAACSTLGLSATLLPGLLWGKMVEGGAAAGAALAVTPELLDQMADVAGLTITPSERDEMVRTFESQMRSLDELRQMPLQNWDPPAQIFNPVLPGMQFEMAHRPTRLAPVRVAHAPKNLEEVAFYTVRQLGELVRSKRVSSLALTQMYLERLRRYDPMLHFVITYTEERALAQAREADRDLAAGRHRGPLHGIPWGAKDLLAAKGYPTTWGAQPYEHQVIHEDATVVKRLDAAGAVLVAKLTLGALAQNDIWFGGMTRNPWKPSQGSSGSSAGPASATSAGCVGFAVGSETEGSISSPSTVCGVTGLRPTFGRVDRSGAMTLSWTQDKLGPLCRSVEDAVLVLQAIYGPDKGNPKADRTVLDVPLNWDAMMPLHALRVGYVQAAFEQESAPPAARGGINGAGRGGRGGRAMTAAQRAEFAARRQEQAQFDNAVLEVLRGMGVALHPVTLPPMPPFAGYGPAVNCEAAAAFDALTRSGRDKLMEAPVPNPSTWPNTFRVAHFYPAVDYLNADRLRLELMHQMQAMFEPYDVVVVPTSGSQLAITNLTGHPAVILPNGFRASDGTPTSITFLGKLCGEEKMCVLARAYQEKTGFHLKHPDLDAELKASQAAAAGV